MTDNEIPPAGCGIVRQHRAHRYFEGETPISRPCSGEGVDLRLTHSVMLEVQLVGRVQRVPQDRSADGAPGVAQEQCHECETTGQNCWAHGGKDRVYGRPAVSTPAPTLADGVAELRHALKPLEEIAPGYHYALVPILDRIAGAVPQRATRDDGNPMWLHVCGRVASGPGCTGPACSFCGEVGNWRALYTLGGE